MSLIGKAIRIVVSDPWDFVTESGSGPFVGNVVDIYHWRDKGMNGVVVHLDSPLPTRPGNLEYLFVFPRHENSGLDELEVGATMPCSITPAPPSSRQGDQRPTWNDVSGPGLIGTAQLS